MKKLFLAVCFTGILQMNVSSQNSSTWILGADKPLFAVQPVMWGVFFEDINFAADGGIYAELVKNRSFEFTNPMMGWKEIKKNNTGQLLIINRGEESPSNRRFARIRLNSANGPYGLSNEGFRGMGIKKDNEYHFSIISTKKEGDIRIRVELVNQQNEIIGNAVLVPGEGGWNTSKVSFRATATEPKARINIWFEGSGILDIDMISLFPGDTWKNRPGGLRADLVQLLAGLKPGFLRFPGGCIVEGYDLSLRYQWKKTIGKPEQRELIINRWNTEFPHRAAHDYFQSFGLGFYEYFVLAEDLGAEPLPILSCGMACQYNSAEVVPMDQLDPYIQDALDLIEFANGPATSRWGKIRAEMGHPAPFGLKMIGIGNEQWGPQYIERYKAFSEAIRAKYPDIKLVSGTGPSPDGADFEYAAAELKKHQTDLVDEHYYRSPEWFFKNAARYDNYDRNTYKIFAGEYASHIPGNTHLKNTWMSALSEAAFMTGLERNADVVHMCSYAPLFAHTEAWQWAPDLIWFDNLQSFGTPNYYVQQLFSLNRGSHVISLLQNGKPLTGQENLYASAVLDKGTNELIMKIVNSNGQTKTQDIKIETTRALTGAATVMVLKCSDPDGMNSLEKPEYISPVSSTIPVKGKNLRLHLDPLSVTVVKLKLR